tara:strand:- start:898 stop:1308 length:411 start_codon:yes stop_codon:yes gene_type:complete
MKTSGTELGNLDDTTTQKEYKEVSSESRARNLAMELSKEKKRLKQELAELQTEVDDLTPTTPTGTPDWYVKWFSMVGAVIGVFAINAGFTMFGQLAYVFSSCGWVYVGMAWGDRAIMIGSAISGTAVLMNIVTGLT